jgi:tetratricopeptide (TPR) repeat protein
MTDVATLKTSTRIRVLNDNFRSRFIGGQVVMSAGVADLPLGTRAQVVLNVQTSRCPTSTIRLGRRRPWPNAVRCRPENAPHNGPALCRLKAEAHAKVGRSDTALKIIDEALAISDETGERWAVAEVLRIKASLLQATGRAAADEIENLLIKSLETGRRQQALSWQLRTACDLARLWQGQGRGEEALTLLQSIYDQFTEGFGTADLIHAKALLENLRANISGPNGEGSNNRQNEMQILTQI